MNYENMYDKESRAFARAAKIAGLLLNGAFALWGFCHKGPSPKGILPYFQLRPLFYQ